ncbi:histone H3/H4 [Paenibacillus sp. DS2015]|uniref:phage tail tape measure protein n=1 Tax=Paenibacillus sp. DS2015 TaxID=3373917 RepID=UPI003D191DB0
MKQIQQSMLQVHKSVMSVRRRLQLFRVLQYGGYGCVGGLFAGTTLLVAARIWPMDRVRWIALGLLLLGIIVGMIWGLLHRITPREAALAMDASEEGPERRDMMVTALSFAGQDQSAVHWQREQAAKYGQRFMADIKSRLPLPVTRRIWISCASLAIVVLALTLLPNPQDTILAKAKQQREWVKTQEKQTEQLSKQLQAEKLVPIVKKPLLEQVNRLQTELAGQKDPLKALDELEKSMNAMEKLAKQQEEKAKSLSQLAEKMRQLKSLSSLSQNLQQNNPKKLDQVMNDLKQEMKKLSSAEKDKLRKDMKKLSEEIPANSENKQLKEALEKLEQALEKGVSAKQDEALQQLLEELTKAIASKSVASQQSAAASALSASLAKQGMSLADQMAAAGLSYSDTWSSGGSGEMLAQAGASGEPSDAANEVSDGQAGQGGEGSNGGQGKGQGQGAGSGGQGSGSGQGTGGNGGTGSGQGAGAGLGTGGREQVTTPRDLAGKGGVQSDGGPTQGGGDIQKGGISPTMDGASRPYAEVYESYADEAKKSLGRSDLPQQMQGLVESYFTSINPNP